MRPVVAASEPEPNGRPGRRVLVVEDSPVLGPFTTELLTEFGYEVVGPAPNLAAARSLAESEDLDAAIVDIHIRGDKAFAICEILADRGVPFLLTSGYADWQMPEQWRQRPRLAKPYSPDELERAVADLFR